jgi:hypothetical protein
MRFAELVGGFVEASLKAYGPVMAGMGADLNVFYRAVVSLPGARWKWRSSRLGTLPHGGVLSPLPGLDEIRNSPMAHAMGYCLRLLRSFIRSRYWLTLLRSFIRNRYCVTLLRGLIWGSPERHVSGAVSDSGGIRDCRGGKVPA